MKSTKIPNHDVAYQKLTQFCRSIIFQTHKKEIRFVAIGGQAGGGRIG